jgi:AAA+ ATPase superfamily predicted ATPase
MAQFVDRQWELRELDALAGAPGAQFVLVYGRRRVGKTTLLLQWAQQARRPYLYWVARRETAEAARQSFARALWRWAYPDDLAATPPRFDSWESLFAQMVRMLPEAKDVGGRPLVLIFDEFSYAVESDPSLPSHVQVLWDHQLRDKPVMLLLAGSHIGMMVDLTSSQAPLFGRFTARLSVGPLPFAALGEFFPHYPAAERVATYAVLGGVPAYLEQFDPGQGLSDNIRRHLFRRTGMFRSEPELLVNDLVRETRNYEATLRAVAGGAHTPSEMAENTGLASPNLAPYLKRLVDLGLLERRIPATVRREQRRNTTRSRYYLRDPYLRFYFRFIEPNLELIELELVDVLWQRIAGQFRAFVGSTAFEELCRGWTLAQARQGRLSFAPEIVGSHWAPDAQVDVVALNWQERAILLGECKWGVRRVGRAVVRELANKTQRVVPGEDWRVHYVLFARAGLTDSARAEAETLGAQCIDLAMLDRDLRQALDLS